MSPPDDVVLFVEGGKQHRVEVDRPNAIVGLLEADVVVTGAPKRLESWNTDRWNAVIAEVQTMPPRQDDLPEVLRKLVG